MNDYSFYMVNVDLFEKLNNFKLLEYLELKGFIFNYLFTLKLSKLKVLNLWNCNNITFNQDICLDIKQLHLYNCKIIKQKNLLRFPVVEECKFFNEFEDEIKTYNSIIDYSSLKKVKILSIEANDFLKLENNPLEELLIHPNFESKEIEIKMIEKIMLINTLKRLSFHLKVIDFNELLKIKLKNTSLEKLLIVWNTKKDCLLKSIHIIFPNLSKIILIGKGIGFISLNKLEIKEELNSKINEIDFGFINENTEMFCQSFENLKRLNIASDSYLIIDFPIFKKTCNIIFNSLAHFKLSLYYQDYPLEFLNNLFDNLEKIPNLIYFDIWLISSEVDENFYIKIIKKIVQQKKLNYIRIEILNNKYNENKFDSLKGDNNSYITSYNPRIGIYIKKN